MFKPGQSGNPAGRKPGESPLAKYRAMLASRANELISQVIDLALAGEPAALKLCLDRLIPPYRPEAVPVEFAMPEVGGLVKMGEAVLSAIGSGILSPEQGAKVLQALAGQSRLIEVEELEQRIAALEVANGQS